MEAITKKWLNLSLRKCFLFTLLGCVTTALLVSLLVFIGCRWFQEWLLPEQNALHLIMETTGADGSVLNEVHTLKEDGDLTFLPAIVLDDERQPVVHDATTKYALKKIVRSIDSLTPKRRFAYRLSQVGMVVTPAITMALALMFCTMIVYRKKLEQPLTLLAQATRNITNQDLDFTIVYENQDELGNLCASFEQMRKALYENNQKLWQMLEERKLIQASIAHDLRNPITVIQGYSEYLNNGLKTHDWDKEKICHIANQIHEASARLQHYTETVRHIGCTEEIQIEKKPVNTNQFLKTITKDFQLLCENKHIELQITSNLPDQTIVVDEGILRRILENIMDNALRYAKASIHLDFAYTDKQLIICIQDDGLGFPAQLRKNTLLYFHEDGHMGIGLSMSRLLCKKHGGQLEIANNEIGACVKIIITL